jgi:flagellar export protein FliJ
MRKFVFRLQIVLDHALRQEEECLQELARLQGLLFLTVEAIERAKVDVQNMKVFLATQQQGVFDASRLMEWRMHLEALNGVVAAVEQERKALEGQVEAQRQRVLDARRKRQGLEKLRDKQYDDHRMEHERQELKNLEDITLPRHVARQTLVRADESREIAGKSR